MFRTGRPAPLSAALGAASLLALAACQSAGPTAKSAADAPVAVAKAAPVLARTDADMGAVMAALASLGGKPIETLSAEEARKQPTPADAVKKVLAQQGKDAAPEPVARVRDVSIPGPGGAIPARVYTPRDAPRGRLPTIVYYHGGGWVLADLDTYDASARALANQAKAIVVSADYRHAPEHKFPAAHSDAFAAYQWTLQNARSLGGDRSRVAVAGESAGGSMAIGVSRLARQHGLAMPVHQLLVYPVAGTDTDTPSYQANENAKPLNKAMMAWFFDKYLKGPEDRNDPLVDVVDAPDLAGLPPTTIITAEIDPLRSEGQTLAQRLRAAGVPVEAVDYEGVTHEFFGMAPVVADAREAQAFAGRRLREALAPKTASAAPRS